MVTSILPKNKQKNGFNYYDTSGRLVFVEFLKEFEDTKKAFQNYLTFSTTYVYNIGKAKRIKNIEI